MLLLGVTCDLDAGEQNKMGLTVAHAMTETFTNAKKFLGLEIALRRTCPL